VQLSIDVKPHRERHYASGDSQAQHPILLTRDLDENVRTLLSREESRTYSPTPVDDITDDSTFVFLLVKVGVKRKEANLTVSSICSEDRK